MCDAGHVFFKRVALLLELVAEEEEQILLRRKASDARGRKTRMRIRQEQLDMRQRRAEDRKGSGVVDPNDVAFRGPFQGKDVNQSNVDAAKNLKQSMGINATTSSTSCFAFSSLSLVPALK